MRPTANAQAPRVNDCVDAVCVLSVRSFADRIAFMREQLARHGIEFRFVFEHDRDAMDPALLAATFGPCDLAPAHRSLILKNIQVWRDAVAHGWRRVLVLEDDALLGDDFAPRLAEAMQAADRLEPGWLVFLGGHDTKVPDSYFLAAGPLVPLPIATNEGCVHDLAAMQRRLHWLQTNKVTLPADHLLRRIDHECGTAQYWLRHPVVEQGSVVGLFDSVLDSHRRKHSRFFNILRNRWNKFQRRRLREWRVRLAAALAPRRP